MFNLLKRIFSNSSPEISSMDLSIFKNVTASNYPTKLMTQLVSNELSKYEHIKKDSIPSLALIIVNDKMKADPVICLEDAHVLGLNPRKSYSKKFINCFEKEFFKSCDPRDFARNVRLSMRAYAFVGSELYKHQTVKASLGIKKFIVSSDMNDTYKIEIGINEFHKVSHKDYRYGLRNFWSRAVIE